MVPKVTCPACNRSYAFKPQLAGRRVTCKCGGSFEFPLMAPVDDADSHAAPAVLTAADAIDTPASSLHAPAVSAPPAPAGNRLLPILIGAAVFCVVLGILGLGALLLYFSNHKDPAPVSVQIGASGGNQPDAPPHPLIQLPPPPAVPPPPQGSTVLQSGDALVYPIRNARLVRVSVHQIGPTTGPFLLTTLTEAQRASIQFPVDPTANPFPNLRLRVTTTNMQSFTTSVQPDTSYLVIVNMTRQPMNINYDITVMQ